MDLESFFDRVNHDILMARVARKVQDKRALRLIRKYLESGVMVEGVVVTTEEGTPQGGPLSPLLANIMLDDLDKELERRGHRFCRYADDFNPKFRRGVSHQVG
jgi:RNA-directed DNA polymerase